MQESMQSVNQPDVPGPKYQAGLDALSTVPAIKAADA